MAGVERAGLGVWAEQSVIGSMLIDPRCVGLVASRMTDSDFTLDANRRLFRAFRDRFARNQVLDPVSVSQDASPGDDGMRTYVMQLMDSTPTAANVEEYIQLARKNSRMTRSQAIGMEISGTVDEETAVKLYREGQAIFSDQGRDDEADMDRATLDFYESLDKAPDFLPWGFPVLDKNLDVGGGNFIVLGGRPSDGKTALALHMAYAQAKTKKVGFFTLEDGNDILYKRLKSAISGVPLRRIMRKALSNQEYELLAATDDEIRARDLTLIDASGWTPEEIISRANYKKFDVIYIDHLQNLRTSGKGRLSRYDEVSDISRQLSTEARASKTVIVALAQLSRPMEKGLRSAPLMSALKESGQIEQDANVIMFIWRRDETSSRTKRYLTIAKNKLGPLGEWKIVFHAPSQRFYPDLVVETPEEAKEPLERQRSDQMTWEDVTGRFDQNFPFGDKEERHDTDR